jgi:dihydropyrimidinase
MTVELPRTSEVRSATTSTLAGPLDIVIANGSVVSSHDVRREDVGVRNGQVVAVGDLREADAAELVDATGLLVLPGVIDAHVHPTYLDDPYQTSVAAVCGGVTSVMHFAYAFGGESLLQTVHELRGASERASLVDFGIHATMFDAAKQVQEIDAVARTGVRTFKVFLAYAAQGWMTDDAALVEVMQAVARIGGMLLVHCENGPAIDALERMAADGAFGDGVGVIGASRPPALEAEAVHRVIMLGSTFGCDVFIVHVTSREALEVVRGARARRLNVAAETCPQYLALTESSLERWGPLAKIGPPLRSASDVEALWGGISDRTLQTIGSDHVPKKTPADAGVPLLDAGFGAPSIETMLNVVYDEGVAGGRIPVTRLVEVMCENPARIFGLWPAKGAVAPGSDADLVLWDPSASRVISADTLHSRSGYTLFEGREVSGRHVATIRAGRIVARDGDLTGIDARGRFLAPRQRDLRLDDPPTLR